MTKLGTTALAATLAVALALGTPTKARAQAMQTGAAANLATSQSLRNEAGATEESDLTQGVGCLSAAGVSMLYTVFVAGPAESIMVVAGGLLVPSTTVNMLLAHSATTFAAACGLGVGLAPLVVWAAEQKDNIAANIAWHAHRTGTSLASLLMGPGWGEPQQPAAPQTLADRAP